MKLPRLTLLAALLSSAPVAGQPEDRRAIVASVDPALLAGPAPLAAPLVFAHGNLGIPRVITWANTAGTSGIAWGTTAAITAANAYISYNATDMLVNVPTATGILFRENEVTHVSIAATGAVLLDGTDDVVQLTVQGFSTQTTFPFVVENSAGTDQFTVSNAGAGVFAGRMTSANATITGTITTDAITTTTLSTLNQTLIDGTSDVVQLTVQGNATQTTFPFVVENSAGTDQFTVSNAGVVTATGSVAGTTGVYAGAAASIEIGVVANQITIATGATPLTLADGFFIDGSYDGVQLTVQGFSTQTTLPFVVENSAGTDEFTVSNTGELVALNQLGTLVAVAANGTGLGGQINAAHISGGGGSTTGAVAGTGCGTSSLPTQSGNDIGGTLGVTCGSAGTTTNPFVTVTFADAYSTAPFCTIDPANAATSAGVVLSQHVAVTTTTTLQVNCGGGVCTTGTLSWAYHCTQ